jgi:hypothetical protein
MSNLLKHAEVELKALGMLDSGDEMNEMMCHSILDLIKTFAEQGHSGFSAGYCLDAFTKLAKYEPLAPLTGADDEWNDVSEQHGGPLWQNRRCSRVLKDANGAYDIDGKVFVDKQGTAYTSYESRTPVTFPYTPKTEYVYE